MVSFYRTSWPSLSAYLVRMRPSRSARCDDVSEKVRPAQRKTDQTSGPSAANVRGCGDDDNLADVSCSFVDELWSTVFQTLQAADYSLSTTASCPLPSSPNLRKLYVYMITRDPNQILEGLAVPLKERFVHKSCQAFLSGKSTPLRLSFDRSGIHEQVLDKDTFCIGRLKTCEVRLNSNNFSASRIHLCVFNMPGSIIMVDGWSWSGTKVEVGGEVMTAACGSPGVFLVPDEQLAVLHIGQESIFINHMDKLPSIGACSLSRVMLD